MSIKSRGESRVARVEWRGVRVELGIGSSEVGNGNWRRDSCTNSQLQWEN
jgi:hypothetical protein